MQSVSIGGGLAAMAFWGFIAIVVAMGIWSSIRKREVQHETLRRVIESGQNVSPEAIQNILSRRSERMDRDLMAAGLITLFIAPGLAVLGWFLSAVSQQALMPLLGTAVLVGCISVGLIVASKVVARSYREEDAEAERRGAS